MGILDIYGFEIFEANRYFVTAIPVKKLDILYPFMKGKQLENTFFNSSSPKRVISQP